MPDAADDAEVLEPAEIGDGERAVGEHRRAGRGERGEPRLAVRHEHRFGRTSCRCTRRASR